MTASAREGEEEWGIMPPHPGVMHDSFNAKLHRQWQRIGGACASLGVGTAVHTAEARPHLLSF